MLPASLSAPGLALYSRPHFLLTPHFRLFSTAHRTLRPLSRHCKLPLPTSASAMLASQTRRARQCRPVSLPPPPAVLCACSKALPPPRPWHPSSCPTLLPRSIAARAPARDAQRDDAEQLWRCRADGPRADVLCQRVRSPAGSGRGDGAPFFLWRVPFFSRFSSRSLFSLVTHRLPRAQILQQPLG